MDFCGAVTARAPQATEDKDPTGFPAAVRAPLRRQPGELSESGSHKSTCWQPPARRAELRRSGAFRANVGCPDCGNAQTSIRRTMLHNSMPTLSSGGNHRCCVWLDSNVVFLRLSNSNLMTRRYLHYWLTLFLVGALIPDLRSQQLPVKFDWARVSVAYWVILGVQSVFLALLLALVGRWQILPPLIRRYRRHGPRLL